MGKHKVRERKAKGPRQGSFLFDLDRPKGLFYGQEVERLVVDATGNVLELAHAVHEDTEEEERRWQDVLEMAEAGASGQAPETLDLETESEMVGQPTHGAHQGRR